MTKGYTNQYLVVTREIFFQAGYAVEEFIPMTSEELQRFPEVAKKRNQQEDSFFIWKAHSFENLLRASGSGLENLPLLESMTGKEIWSYCSLTKILNPIWAISQIIETLEDLAPGASEFRRVQVDWKLQVARSPIFPTPVYYLPSVEVEYNPVASETVNMQVWRHPLYGDIKIGVAPETGVVFWSVDQRSIGEFTW